MKVAPSGSRLRKIKHLRVPNKISINSACSRFSNGRKCTRHIERIMRMHFCRAWKHNRLIIGSGLSRSPSCLLHVTYTRNEIFKGSARPARNFSLFFVRRYGRVSDDWHSLAVFFQGPIGLDGPKGDPVSSPHNLHFNFVVALQACEINCFVKAREAIFYFATLNVLRITLFNRIMVMGV